MIEYGLGRLHAPDERDRNFPMRAALRPVAAPVSKIWWPGTVLDQGQTPQCVGFAWRGWMLSSPERVAANYGPDGPAIYAGAQQNDEFPGTDYEGSSVRGGAKFLTASGSFIAPTVSRLRCEKPASSAICGWWMPPVRS